MQGVVAVAGLVVAGAVVVTRVIAVAGVLAVVVVRANTGAVVGLQLVEKPLQLEQLMQQESRIWSRSRRRNQHFHSCR